MKLCGRGQEFRRGSAQRRDLRIYVNGRPLSRHARGRGLGCSTLRLRPWASGVWGGAAAPPGAGCCSSRAHLKRLYEGLDAIALPIGLTPAELTAEIRRTLDANGMQHGAHLRLMVTRGEKKAVNQDPRNWLGKPTIVITAEYKEPSPAIVTKGLALATSRSSARRARCSTCG